MQQVQIVEVIKSLHKPTLAKIITRTLVHMNKFSKDKTKANPYKRVHKVSTLIVELNPAGKSSVNQQRITESRAWGKHVGHGIFERNGKTYISVISKRVVMVNHLTCDALIEKSEIENFLPKQSTSNKQNLDNLVAYRTFSVDNILSIQLIDSTQPQEEQAMNTNRYQIQALRNMGMIIDTFNRKIVKKMQPVVGETSEARNERFAELSVIAENMNTELKTITVKEHFDNFFLLQSAEVFTPDGWQVTAVQDDGVTHHLWHSATDTKKVCPLNTNDLLIYKPTPQSISHGL